VTGVDEAGGPGPRVAATARAVLVLEAATPAASVAVLAGGRVLAVGDAHMRPGVDDALLPAVDAALRAAGVRPAELAAVACGAGPGGFTSLRVAAALAKGLVHAAGCALLAAPSLALAAAARAAGAGDGARAWRVTLDALRGERYAADVETDARAGRVRVVGYRYLGVRPAAEAAAAPADRAHVDANASAPRAEALTAFDLAAVDLAAVDRPAVDRPAVGAAASVGAAALALAPLEPDTWEPDYGRQAEAQARWELAHGRPLATALRGGEVAAGP
jgi:tRNA threonylcarbamoyladenosine biosynthesis protein TsaB